MPPEIASDEPTNEEADERVLSTRIPDLRNVSFKDLQQVVKDAKETPLGNAIERMIDEPDASESPVMAGWNSRISNED